MAPATTSAAAGQVHLKAQVADALGRLWRYLQTWQTADGRFGGMIATWWSSTVEIAVPHPMNQFPIVLGLLQLHRAGIGGASWLDEATRVGAGLAASVDPEGWLENGWGDIPGKHTGPVFYTSCTRALCELFALNKREDALQAALRMDRLVTRQWARGDALYGCPVTNQVLSWAWSKLALAGVTGESSLVDQAHRIAVGELAQQVARGALAGAFHQGRSDDRLISIYVGKCIQPLLEIGRVRSDDRLVTAARRAAEYLTGQEIKAGIWLNYRGPVGVWRRLMRPVTSLDRRIFRLRVPVYRLRRSFLKWTRVDYPSWYARSADSVRAMLELSLLGLFNRQIVEEYVRKLLALQYPDGGFPNTVGFFGDAARRDWQDATPCTRWNAYVFLLLARLSEVLGVESIPVPANDLPARQMELSDGLTLEETPKQVQMVRGSEICWRMVKPDGANTALLPSWRGDLSGDRAQPACRRS